jgi:stearoyl-CoA desaturase (delta-9 desaturase)
MLNGLLDLSPWGYLVAALLTTHITIAAVTIFLHRTQSHRAVELHPVVSHFFRLWLWLTTGMITKEWVAIHRKHHANSDRSGDPHSPVVFGIRKVLLEGSELYREEAKNLQTLSKYGHGTPDDWIERHLYTRWNYLGVSLLLPTYLALFGLIGISIWALQMIWIPIWAAGVINGVGHYRGYRNYESADASTNIVPWGIVIGGEELHNNHHAFPSSARFSAKWWEFDLGWTYLRVLERIGFARIKKVAPRPVIIPNKQIIDMDTLRAVIVSRLHVSAHYARAVIGPVVRQELAGADASWRKLLKRSKKCLVRNEVLMDARARDRLEQVLSHSSALRTVHQFRQQLLELWGRTATSHEQLLHSLQDWCRRAESTGIESLAEFARTLRGYELRAS